MNPMGMTKSCTQRTKSSRSIKEPAERIDTLCAGGGFLVAFLGDPQPNGASSARPSPQGPARNLHVFWRNVTAKRKDDDQARPKSPAAASSRHRRTTKPSWVRLPMTISFSRRQFLPEIIDAPFGPSSGFRIEALLGVIGRPLVTA